MVRLDQRVGEEIGIGSFHPQGGGVDDEIDFVELRFHGVVIPRKSFETVAGAAYTFIVEVLIEFISKKLGFLGGAIDEDKTFAFFDGALHSDGPAGASSGSKYHDPEIADVDGELFADGSEEARAIAIEANEGIVLYHNGVDGPDSLGEVINFIHCFQSVGLMRNGDVRSDKILLREEAQGVCELVRFDLETDVLGIDPRGFKGGIVHLWGQGVGDGGAEDGEAGGRGEVVR